MATPRFLFTQEDYDALCERIEEVGQQVREQTASVGGAAGSSGDAWHDNLLYDAQRMSESWSKSLRDLLEIRDRATVVEGSPPRDGKVRFGTTVRVLDIQTGEKASYRISSYMIIESTTGKGVRRVSYASPLGNLLLGAEIGETRTGTMGGGQRTFEVCEIIP